MEDRLVRAVEDVRSRMDELSLDLSDALERAEHETRRNRFLGDLSSSIDLEELLERILDAALEVPGFDAAMITLEDVTGPMSVAVRGLTAEEAARPPGSGIGGPEGPMTVVYRYGPDDVLDSELIRGGLFQPLRGRDQRILGSLALYWRKPDQEPPRACIELVEELAEACVPAIENARRYREARQQAETDALTGLYNQRHFHETLRREVQRAQRYGRQLALAVFDLDDFKAINDRIGHLAGDAALTQVAERLRDHMRSVDIACRIGGDEFGVILPESTAQDAEHLVRRVHDALRAAPTLGGQEVRLSAGIAELEHGETAPGLFERADAALYAAKEGGKDRFETARGPQGRGS
jgi:diguanylate cyclase (GGDEF)-like protein